MAVSNIALKKDDLLTCEFMAIHSIEVDIRQCSEYLKLLKNLKSSKTEMDLTDKMTPLKYLIQSVCFTFVILYIKIFTSGTHKIKFTPGEVYKNDPQLLSWHKQVRDYRSHYIAHSVNYKGEKLTGASIIRTHGDSQNLDFEHVCKPNINRDFELGDDSITICNKLIDVCRAYWIIKHDEIYHKILHNLLPCHLENLRPYLNDVEYECIKNAFSASDLKIKGEIIEE